MDLSLLEVSLKFDCMCYTSEGNFHFCERRMDAAMVERSKQSVPLSLFLCHNNYELLPFALDSQLTN